MSKRVDYRQAVYTEGPAYLYKKLQRKYSNGKTVWTGNHVELLLNGLILRYRYSTFLF